MCIANWKVTLVDGTEKEYLASLVEIDALHGQEIVKIERVYK